MLRQSTGVSYMCHKYMTVTLAMRAGGRTDNIRMSNVCFIFATRDV